MPRPPSPIPTDVELAILRVLWNIGPASVRQVHNALLPHRPDAGYSTTLKMIQVMTDKGLLLKDDSQRPQIYSPAQPQEQTQLHLLDDLIQRGFGGSAMNLVMRALDARRVDPHELAEIRKLLKQHKRPGERHD
ncbi:MAG TPA: BlaI/MecI/CopY family transcriptional regulator [Phycisphaerae bacterium]|nr:BlaI/MecI/CopY family transcriptional regulator [Phycisphaerae bacterium]